MFRGYLKFTPVGEEKTCLSTTILNMQVLKQPILDKIQSWKTIFMGQNPVQETMPWKFWLAK